LEETNKLSGDNESINYFIANSIYPDVKSLFQFESKSLDEIKNDCVVVLDTNVLLIPYTIGSKSIHEIKGTFSDLISQNRLFLPEQVVREFVKNRPNKLSELYQQVSDHKSKVHKIDTPIYPLFESLPEYKEALRLQEEVNSKIKEYSKEIEKVLNHIKGMNWNDQVSLIYKELFNKDQIIELFGEQKAHIEDFKFRSQHNIPPGFKDKAKPDGGIGDYLIWKTILQIGKETKKDVIFVSGDEKNDWYHQSMKQPLYPRYELIQEYSRICEGATFRIMSFSDFLALYGATYELVKEVHIIENDLNNPEFVKTNNYRLIRNLLNHPVHSNQSNLFKNSLNLLPSFEPNESFNVYDFILRYKNRYSVELSELKATRNLELLRAVGYVSKLEYGRYVRNIKI
jgi:rRNA-processing protein FCF1